MRDPVSDATFCVVTLVVMLGSALAVDQFGLAAGHQAGELVRTLTTKSTSAEAREQQTAGYYEGLLDEGSRVSAMSLLVTGGVTRAADDDLRFGRDKRRRRLSDRYHFGDDFLFFEPRPHMDVPDYTERPHLRFVTNAHGLADRPYDVQKPAGTRRIALFGDSVSRGMGAPFGTAYEALLEEYLNHTHGMPRRFEVLNFSVSAYRISQMFDVAVEKAPRFSPDVYVFALSELIGARRWGEHLATLVARDIDLKYDIYRSAVAEAGLTSADAPSTALAKLARVRLSVLRDTLSAMRAHAARHGAHFVVLLVPNARPFDEVREDFEGVRPILEELGVPYADLTDAFAEVSDLAPYRVSEDNVHPNERGHRRLFEHLAAILDRSLTLREAVVGSDDEEAADE